MAGSEAQVYHDYWTEIQQIQTDKPAQEEEDELPKTPDEGEREETFLKEIGLDVVVNRIKDGKDLTEDEVEALTDSLTESQAAVVKRRVDTLKSTVRKKQRHNIPDVREIFPSSPANVPAPQGQWNQAGAGKPSTGKAPFVSRIYVEDTTPSQARRGSKTKDKIFRKGGYSMSGEAKGELVNSTEKEEDDYERPDNPCVSVISLHHKGERSSLRGFHRPELSSISDLEISFDLSAEDTKENKRNKSRNGSESSDSDLSVGTDKEGVTRACDLSQEDMTKIRALALLELTALYDINNIMYASRKPRKKVKDHGLFGVPLMVLLEQDRKITPDTKVPLVIKDMINFLEKHCLDVEGILRVPGLVSRVKQLRSELEEKFYLGAFSWVDVAAHDAASLFKLFLRELPIPLLTNEYIEAFAQVEGIKEKQLQIQALNYLILVLPPVHRDTLQLIVSLLWKVTCHSSENKMGLENVSMIMAPNLFFYTNSFKSKPSMDQELSMATRTSNVVHMLIKHQDMLWTVPQHLLAQMRRNNELATLKKNKEKSIMKRLTKKEKGELYRKPDIIRENEFEDGVIRIQAPNLTKSSMAIRLEPDTTARDIVDRFRVAEGTNTKDRDLNKGDKKTKGDIVSDSHNVTFAKANTYLYEVGGNIGERCLDPQANMLAVYNTNPNAEWVIKTEPHR